MSCAEMAKSVDMPFGRDSGGFREREEEEIPPKVRVSIHTGFVGRSKAGREPPSPSVCGAWQWRGLRLRRRRCNRCRLLITRVSSRRRRPRMFGPWTRRTRRDGRVRTFAPPPSAPWLCAKAVYLRAERPIFEPATFSVASPTL